VAENERRFLRQALPAHTRVPIVGGGIVGCREWRFLKGAMVQGTVRLIQRGPEFRKIRALLYEKYPQYPDETGLDEGDDTIVEVTPLRVAAWEIDE
jgi:hypothetical protein